MDYPTLICEERKAQELTSQQSRSFYAVCQHLVDGRAARGKRYDLAALVTLLILAKLAGMKSLLGASEWIADQQERLCERLPLSWKRMPCANTYKYALARLDRAQVNEELAAWLVRSEAESRCGQEPSRLLSPHEKPSVHPAIDGKALQSVARQIRRFASHPDEALAWVI